MCGLTGFLSPAVHNQDELRARILQMTETLAHRGPDDRGLWVDAASGVALGHRRLSILDLSELGRQPMLSASGRFVVILNGEVYNHGALRRELQSLGHTFLGHSDTEVLLAAVAEWGLERAVKRFIGMFAFALWDRDRRELALVRDAIGIKPLYYGWMQGCFLFGSELKALRAHPAFHGEIDRKALSSYMHHCYVPGPKSIYRGIFKLPPGSILVVRAGTGPGQAEPVAWWSMAERAEEGLRNPFSGSDEEAVDELDAHLRDSVALQMLADVPVGAFLSGGIDSSTVVALMQAQSTRPVRTFSIGFEERGYDEAGYAKAVAGRLGTDHTECYVTPDEAREVIPQLPQLYDEPFADSSQIPTFLVSRIARRGVTVSLSGDGGDELFFGYDRYSHLERLWQRVAWCPVGPRRAVAPLVRWAAAAVPPGVRGKARLAMIADLLAAGSASEVYARFNSHWRDASAIVAGGSEPLMVRPPRGVLAAGASICEQMAYVDAVTYLPDDILVKVDRASMALGLEARVPLLDQRVVEFAWRLPHGLKVRQGQTKWVLRQVLERYVPRQMIERPKMGFGVPIDSWLRGPLRDWAESLLSRRRLESDGYFQPEPIRRKWSEHLSGRTDWQYHLWDVLMFQAWLDGEKDRISRRATDR